MMSTVRSLVIAGTAAALLAACSSTSSTSVAPASGSTSTSTPSSAAGTDAATYMEALCTDISTWQTSLTAGNQTFQDAVSTGNPTPEDVKAALETYLTTAVEDTQTLASEIEALGVPGVEGGEDVSTTVVTALNNVATLFQTILDQVQQVDTTNPAAMATALQDLVPQLQQGAQDVAGAFGSIDNSELTAAANDIPACTSIG
jgi:hypothetical protein